jgi:hypothetical protein
MHLWLGWPRKATLTLATLPDPTGTHGEVESMSIAEATARGCLPEASDETLQAFSYSEMKLYKHAIAYK